MKLTLEDPHEDEPVVEHEPEKTNQQYHPKPKRKTEETETTQMKMEAKMKTKEMKEEETWPYFVSVVQTQHHQELQETTALLSHEAHPNETKTTTHFVTEEKATSA